MAHPGDGERGDAAARLAPGFEVGHWTDPGGRSGCTVVLPPPGNVASCDVRGSSPSTREIEHLHPDRRLTEVHAVVLSGGSAFGLAAAHGAVEWLAERGIGYQTSVTPIPIVPAAVVFDLGAAHPDARPGPDAGRHACEHAAEEPIATGRVGAGTGCTVGKWAGFEHRSHGGLGLGRAAERDLEATALAVVNSVGDVIDEDGSVIAGSTAGERRMRAPGPPGPGADDAVANTVLVVVALGAHLDKRAVRWLAQRGTDGITVSVRPAHTRYDGDVVFAIAGPGPVPQPEDLDVLGGLATRAVAAAVRDAVRPRP